VSSSGGAILRVAGLVLGAVVLQLTLVAQVTVMGANADLLLLVALAVGLLGGPVAGATTGFLLGLVADMALLQTLGVTSLLLTGVGYMAGRYRELRDASHRLVPALAAVAAGLAFSACFAIIQFLLGVESTVSLLVVRDAVVGALLGGLLALPVFALVRAALRPELVDDLRPPPRRRPAPGLRLS
jgi:rod shape-determining protein MreD